VTVHRRAMESLEIVDDIVKLVHALCARAVRIRRLIELNSIGKQEDLPVYVWRYIRGSKTTSNLCIILSDGSLLPLQCRRQTH
jgi:hypothetical protein